MGAPEHLLELSKEFASATLKKVGRVYTYHNLEHTEMVVRAARIIGHASHLTLEQLNMVLIAAWFHDVDYYKGVVEHEERSALIAERKLIGWGAAIDLAREVSQAIIATRIPQSPRNLFEMVLCDADLSHLGSKKYEMHASRLRSEWEATRFFKPESNYAWCQFNLEFLKTHHYFTDYGKTILERRKITNINRIVRTLQGQRPPFTRQ